jgi:hypothetical protein
MLNLGCVIKIIQQPTTDFPSRNKSYTLDFINDAEITSTWQNLTDTAKMIFPKNIYFVDETGRKVTWQGKNVIGGSDTPPLILRGDKVTVDFSYSYYETDKGNSALFTNNFVTKSNNIFNGFISKAINKMPIEIHCEDNMWKLKQVSAPNKVFKATEYNLQTMLQELLTGTGFTVNTDATTNIGDFRTQNETVAEVLNRLQKYNLESYFRGDELRCSGLIYYPEDANEEVFVFQKNIISDNLEYRRTDDVKIGIQAYSVNKVELNTVNSQGKRKTKIQRLSAFITRNLNGEIVELNPASFEGEKRTLYYYNVADKATLISQAGTQLNKLYYEGFFGKFTTFGLPFVKHGDHAILRDDVLPERNGTYEIKEVVYRFGMDGYRQDIGVDIRIDGISNTLLSQGL